MRNKGIWVGIGIVLIIFVGVAFFMLGKVSDIADIKNENYVGKTVAVRGTVQATLKIGSLSGYTLKDDTDTIAVSSQQLPKEGETITTRGTLIHDTLLGYYIQSS